ATAGEVSDNLLIQHLAEAFIRDVVLKGKGCDSFDVAGFLIGQSGLTHPLRINGKHQSWMRRPIRKKIYKPFPHSSCGLYRELLTGERTHQAEINVPLLLRAIGRNDLKNRRQLWILP